MKEEASQLFLASQEKITNALEKHEDGEQFKTENWTRDNSLSSTDKPGISSGGGKTMVLSGGKVFEKAGVNFSSVGGSLPSDLSNKLTGDCKPAPFFATGISLVIHPYSPMIPTVHSNYRYLEVGDFSWFGGGADLTPYVLYEEDCQHFHQTLHSKCANHPLMNYNKFKQQCDEYFYLPHREEHRGIGGIFFDYLAKEEPKELKKAFQAVEDLALCFPDLYLPIVEKRVAEPFDNEEKEFQLMRRGRYVEFNLLHDRGTQFGLKTGGRTESILMSLPPEVKWHYNQQFIGTEDQISKQQLLLKLIKNPKPNWIN